MLLFQIHKPSQTASSSLILFRCSSMPMASSLFRSSFLLGCVCGVSGRGEDADGPHYTYVFEGIVLTVMILVLSNCMCRHRREFLRNPVKLLCNVNLIIRIACDDLPCRRWIESTLLPLAVGFIPILLVGT